MGKLYIFLFLILILLLHDFQYLREILLYYDTCWLKSLANR